MDGDDILLSCGNPAATEEVERVFLEEYHRSLVNEILMIPEYMGGEIGRRLRDRFFSLPDEEYCLILDMIRARENEYIEDEVMTKDDLMSDVIADEIVRALVMKAKDRKER